MRHWMRVGFIGFFRVRVFSRRVRAVMADELV